MIYKTFSVRYLYKLGYSLSLIQWASGYHLISDLALLINREQVYFYNADFKFCKKGKFYN